MGIVGVAQGVEFAATASCAGAMAAVAWGRLGANTYSAVRTGRVAQAAGAAALLSHAVIFAKRSGEMLEKPVAALQPRDFSLVGGHTWFGYVWLLQGFMLLSAVLALSWWRAAGTGALLGFGSLGVLPMSGHVIADSSGWFAELGNVVHVLLCGVWFGGLVTLALLPVLVDGNADSVLILRLRAFSVFALPSMLVILASGCLLSSVTVNRWAALFASSYGTLLCLKLSSVAIVLLSAARIRRRLAQGAATDGCVLRRSLQLEIIFASLSVLVAGVMSQTTPAAHADLVWRLPFRFVPGFAWNKPGVPVSVAAGTGIALIALFIAVVRRRRLNRWGVGGACATALAGSGYALQAVAVAAFPTTYVKAPVGFDANAIASGRQVFLQECVPCHGVTGRGDGAAAAALKPPPADLTAPHVGDHTGGDMFWWISHGMRGSSMPGYAGRISETERWQLVMYLMALSHGYQARVISDKAVPGEPWLPAIDFAVDTGTDSHPTLLEPRGQHCKLVVIGSDPTQLAAEAARFAAAAHLLEAAGVEVVFAVPGPVAEPLTHIKTPVGVYIVSDRGRQITEAWNLYRRSFQRPDFSDREPAPSQIAYLVDRFGFVRARWRSDETVSLPGPDQLVAMAQTLAREPDLRSASDHEH